MQGSNANQGPGGDGNNGPQNQNQDGNQANRLQNDAPPMHTLQKQGSNFEDPGQNDDDEFEEGANIGKPRAMAIEAGKSPGKEFQGVGSAGQVVQIPQELNAELGHVSCNFQSHIILMKGITWGRDSHGLFDYESRHLTKKTMRTDSEIFIMRHSNELISSSYSRTASFEDQVTKATVDADDKALLKIVNNNANTFYLESASCNLMNEEDMRLPGQAPIGLQNLNENMYLVVRSLKRDNDKIDYEIQEKDILKIGRVKFAVKEINYSDDSIAKQETPTMEVDQAEKTPDKSEIERGHAANSIFDKPNDELFEEFNEVGQCILDQEAEQDDDEELMKCRFCWQTEATAANPLLNACNCHGTVGSIHLSCLKNWLEVKRQQKQSENFTSFFWKSFECEICKKAYPLMLKAGGMKFDLVQYEKPQGDYMVLESLNQEKNTSRIIHVIRPSLTKTIFKLGRGHESDLRINDISVSRCHAKIKLENGKFMLEDNQSKFGTLVLVKRRTPLLPGFNKAVQVGRTVINFSVKAHNPQRETMNANKVRQLALEATGGYVPRPPMLSAQQPASQTMIDNESNAQLSDKPAGANQPLNDANGGVPNMLNAESFGNLNQASEAQLETINNQQIFGNFAGHGMMQSQSEQSLGAAQNLNYQQQMAATGQGFFGGLRGDEDYQLQLAIMQSQEEAQRQQTLMQQQQIQPTNEAGVQNQTTAVLPTLSTYQSVQPPSTEMAQPEQNNQDFNQGDQQDPQLDQ